MIVHQNPYFSVNLKDDYYSISFPTEQVVILPVVDKRNILFIKAIRPVFDKPVIELPAGMVDEGETVKAAALREFREETGIPVENESRFKPLPSLNNMPSRTNHMLNIFMVDITMDEYQNRAQHDSEVSETLLLPHNEMIEKINQGEFFTAPFIAACLIFLINTNNMK